MNRLEVKDNVIQLERELGIKENSITVDLEDDILYLSGEVESWKLMVDFCHMAAKIPEVKSVVSHIKTPETKPEVSIDLTPYKEMGVIKKADVVIIGGGVTGCGAARTLSQYDLKIVVVEKESDICEGTTKANNGMIHSGYDSKPGSLKALCCVEGNRMYSQWAADEIARMAGDEFYTIHPRRGTIAIFDKENKGKIHTFSGKAPNNYTKGGGAQETPEGTLLWGPSAKEVPDKEDLGVDRDELDFIIDKGMELTKNISQDTLITYFSGNRAATFQEDFIIANSKKVQGFMHVAGIQSPGLASAPAIAKRVEGLLLEMLPDVKKKEDYNPIRVGKKPFRECSSEERRELIRKNPAYGTIICRCETITEGEIVDAIHGKIPARTVDAVKRRTRAGMGRCQGGFCGGRVVEILARELEISPKEVTLKGKDSEILIEETRCFEGGEL